MKSESATLRGNATVGIRVAVIAIVALGVAIGHAATLVVSNLSDSGPGSLREAIASANSGDTVSFSVNGTITLTSGTLPLTNNLSIEGPGAKSLSISGEHHSRVFNIGPTAVVAISGVTICNGLAPAGMLLGFCDERSAIGGNGGAILNGGHLTLLDCSVLQSGAGAGVQYSCLGGYWAVSGGSGGGIFNQNVLVASGCTVAGNSAGAGANGSYYVNLDNHWPTDGAPGGAGGGIFNGGVMALTNCTITSNFAGNGGAGSETTIHQEGSTFTVAAGGGEGGSGAGIFNNGSLFIVACTVATNTVGQPGATPAANFVMSGPANVGTGAAIYNQMDSSAAQLLNTIVSSSLAGSFTSLGHNLITYPATGFNPGANSDLVGSANSPLDPQLGPLEDNGGPTPTMAVSPGSPAIDTGDDSLLASPYNITTDQRGFPRRSGSHVDIGAFELRPPSSDCSLVCPTNIETCNDPGQCSAVVEFPESLMSSCDGFVITTTPASGSAFPVGTNIVTSTAVDLGSGQLTNTCSFQIIVRDCEPPVVSCQPVPKPSDKKNGKPDRDSERKEDFEGFYQLMAHDNCDSSPRIYIKDSASSFVAGPFSSGDIVKFTKKHAGRDSEDAKDGNNSRPPIVRDLQLQGNGLLYGVDASGNVGASVLCNVKEPRI